MFAFTLYGRKHKLENFSRKRMNDDLWLAPRTETMINWVLTFVAESGVPVVCSCLASFEILIILTSSFLHQFSVSEWTLQQSQYFSSRVQTHDIRKVAARRQHITIVYCPYEKPLSTERNCSTRCYPLLPFTGLGYYFTYPNFYLRNVHEVLEYKH